MAITHIPGYTELLGQSDNINSTAEAYARVPLFKRAVQLRADALASVPWIIRQGENEKEWPFASDLDELLWQTEASMLMTGAAYWLRLRNTVRTMDIIPLVADSIEVGYSNGIYSFSQPINGHQWTLDDIVYFRHYDPSQDVFPGVGEGGVALSEAQQLNYMTRLLAKYFESGAMPSYLVEVGAASPAELKRIERWFSRRFGGLASGVGRVLGLMKVPPVTKLTPDLKEMVLPEAYEQAKKNLAAAFGIPITMLEESAANRATATEHRLSFFDDTVRPAARKVAATINQQLLAPLNLELVFDFEEMSIFQEDEEQRSGSFVNLVNGGLKPRLALEILGYDLDDEQWAMVDEEDEEPIPAPPPFPPQQPTAEDELRKWQKMAEKRMREGKPEKAVSFTSDLIAPALQGAIAGALETVTTPEDVQHVFRWVGYP